MKLFRYQRKDGIVPISVWLNEVRDKTMQARIRMRLKRLATGNLGDIKPVGGGVSELRLHFGPGYRVYLAQCGSSWLLLLCGGTKSNQNNDIALAKKYFEDWKERRK